MKIYAYIRVSSKTQNISRQLEEIKKLNVDNNNIYIDKESGKDFNRTNYKKLIKKLKKDDLLIIKSICCKMIQKLKLWKDSLFLISHQFDYHLL